MMELFTNELDELFKNELDELFSVGSSNKIRFIKFTATYSRCAPFIAKRYDYRYATNGVHTAFLEALYKSSRFLAQNYYSYYRLGKTRLRPKIVVVKDFD